jgi:siroheme synthase-like protein
VFLELHGVPVLVVGGGAVAARKVADLALSHARVTIVSPAMNEELIALGKVMRASTFPLKLIKRRFRPGDMRGMRLIFAATDDPVLNARICRTAQAKRLLANCAAPPEAGNFAVPATVRRGLFCLAISTGGTSAALAAHWRERLEKITGNEWGTLASLLWKKRREVKTRIADADIRREVLTTLGHPYWAVKIKKSGIKAIERRMDALIASAATASDKCAVAFARGRGQGKRKK